MRNAKLGFMSLLICASLSGAVALTTLEPATGAPQELKTHWRHHDGHWSYYYAPDNAWYYTDGSNWYYNNGGAWTTYNFDKGFGREGFERGEYRVPGEGTKVAVPTHKVWSRK